MVLNVDVRFDPVPEWRYDGISVNPFEIMFVPMDTAIVENGWTYAKQSAVYDSWLSLQVCTSVLYEISQLLFQPAIHLIAYICRQ